MNDLSENIRTRCVWSDYLKQWTDEPLFFEDLPSQPENKLTEEDINTIQYFWLEKGDLTRWVDWEKRLPLIKKQYPELIDAFERYEIAIKTVTAIVKGLG